MSTVRCLS